MTPLNICVCFCWACSSSVELSFNSNLVLRQSELLLLISPSVGRFMHFYHNKWESFITPDTTRLKRIVVLQYVHMYHVYSLLSHLNALYLQQLFSILSLTVSYLSIRIYALVHIVNVEKRRFSQGQPLFDGAGVGGREKIGAAVWLHLSAVAPQSIWGGILPSSHHTPSKNPPSSGSSTQTHTTTPWSTSWAKPLLCQPTMLQWRHDVMVHFVVPGILIYTNMSSSLCIFMSSCMRSFESVN